MSNFNGSDTESGLLSSEFVTEMLSVIKALLNYIFIISLILIKPCELIV